MDGWIAIASNIEGTVLPSITFFIALVTACPDTTWPRSECAAVCGGAIRGTVRPQQQQQEPHLLPHLLLRALLAAIHGFLLEAENWPFRWFLGGFCRILLVRCWPCSFYYRIPLRWWYRILRCGVESISIQLEQSNSSYFEIYGRLCVFESTGGSNFARFTYFPHIDNDTKSTSECEFLVCFRLLYGGEFWPGVTF